MKFNNIAKRIAAAGLAAGLVLTTSMVSMAAKTYDPVAGTSCKFNKFLIMDAGATVPNVTFSFTVAPGAAVSADTSDNAVMQVLPGIGIPTIADVTFSSTDTTETAAGTYIDVARAASDRVAGLTAATGVQLETGEIFARKEATVSFDGISFNEPGIYRYIISEEATGIAGIMQDNDTDRVLDVYVIDTDGNLQVAGYVLHKNVSAPVINTDMGSADVEAAGEKLGDKTDGFTNEYNTKDLRISKEVSGNQASRDKWFEFTVKLTGVNEADKYVVSIATDDDANTTDGNADAKSGTTAATRGANQNKNNPVNVTGAELMSDEGVKVYLQHGQNIVIRGIAQTASYTVTEDAEDYKSAVMTGKTNSGVIGTVAGDGKVAEAGFTNTRTGVVPTGVILDSAPFIIIIGLAVAALAFTALRKKSR